MIGEKSDMIFPKTALEKKMGLRYVKKAIIVRRTSRRSACWLPAKALARDAT
jgi:hypothetical protein